MNLMLNLLKTNRYIQDIMTKLFAKLMVIPEQIMDGIIQRVYGPISGVIDKIIFHFFCQV